jgi:hypothetical protein
MIGNPLHAVPRQPDLLTIDSNWYKPQWKKIRPVVLRNYMGQKPFFLPEVQVKMTYDSERIYLIWRVNERYTRCIHNQVNGRVWEDSCVEFFFSPDNRFPDRYFNLEINCGGTPLMHYNISQRKKMILPVDDIKTLNISHSLPEIIDPEIRNSVSWSLEYCVPLKLLEKYTDINYPKSGTSWRANFYKIAENCSNPHYLTWSHVENPEPDFHIPKYFGFIKFL